MKPVARKGAAGAAVSVLFLLLLISPDFVDARAVQDVFPTVEFESAFTAGNEVPLHWVEVMIFAKNPATVEFFERPVVDESLPRKLNPTTGRWEAANKLTIKLNRSTFSSGKVWLLYRIGDRAEESETFDSPELRALLERFRGSAWVFELPFSPNLNRLSVNAGQLAYTLGDSASRSVVGAAFRASHFPYKGRKGGEGFARVDNLSRAASFLESLNKDLPPEMRLDLANNKVWQAEISLHLARNNGPGERDKAVIEAGYTPIFVVFRNSPVDVDLARDPWFVAPMATKKVIYTNLAKEVPDLWANLSAEAKRRYQNPDRIKAGEEIALIVFWKHADSRPPNVFFIYGRLTATREDLKTVVVRHAPAAAS